MGRLTALHRKRSNGNRKKGSNSNSRKTDNQAQHGTDGAVVIGGGTSSWVDRLDWVPVDEHYDEDDDNDEEESSIPPPKINSNDIDDKTNRATSSPTLSIISWNLLAEAYCSRRSHTELPKVYEKRVFDKLQRRELLVRTLTRLLQISHNPNVLCFQEWDLPQILAPVLQRHGYTNAAETPRVVGGGAGGRTDACVVYVRISRSSSSTEPADSDLDHHRHLNHNTNTKQPQRGGGGWDVVEHQIVRFDDLATLSSSSSSTTTPKATTTIRANEKTCNTTAAATTTAAAAVEEEGVVVEAESFGGNNLQGIQRSFLRRNMGLLVRLRHVDTQRTVIVANAHLYWNPGFEYIKLLQAHYILKRMKAFQNHEQEPVLLCGDLNSRPHGIAHTYLTHGVINAKLVAPWYAIQTNESEETIVEEEEEMEDDDGNDDDDGDVAKTTTESPNREETAEKERDLENLQSITNGVSNLTVEPSHETSSPAAKEDDNIPDIPKDKHPQMRYMLDASLNKFCRWLRILGQDVALETDAEEQLRTGRGELVIFDRCRDELRTLVTTSPRLMERRDCPASAYCISPPFLQSVQKLECCLMHLLLTHGVVLEPSSFLGRCVVCNGSILEVHGDDEKRRILTGHKAPAELINDGLDVYECNGCQQGYWWNDNPMSSASRVKNSASHLFELCLRAGVPFRGPHEALFDHLDVEGLRKQGWDYTIPGSELLQERLDVIDWLKDEHLEAPFALESAYCQKSTTADGQEILTGESIPFTNVTFGFVSVLDYIFFDTTSTLTLVDRLYIPTSFPELADGRTKLRNAHLLPSDVWPSDHLAIGARFALSEQQNANEKVLTSKLMLAERAPSTTASPKASQNTSSISYTHETFQFCEPTAVPNDKTSTVSPSTSTPETLQFCLPTALSNDNTSLPSLFSTDPAAAAAAAATLHGSRCACGCVPPIPSLFEMAAMRKRYQEAKARSANNNVDSTAKS